MIYLEMFTIYGIVLYYGCLNIMAIFIGKFNRRNKGKIIELDFGVAVSNPWPKLFINFRSFRHFLDVLWLPKFY